MLDGMFQARLATVILRRHRLHRLGEQLSRVAVASPVFAVQPVISRDEKAALKPIRLNEPGNRAGYFAAVENPIEFSRHREARGVFAER